MIKRFFVLAALGAMLAIPVPPAHADMSIQAIVNGTPITSYDVNQRAKLLQLTARTPAARAKKEALEELIDEQLQVQATRRSNINITDSQVDDAYATIAERVKMSPSRLSTALRQSGVEPKTLKKRLRAQIGWQQLVTVGARRSRTVTEQEVVAALKADQDRQSGTTSEVLEYDLTQVTFVVPKAAGKSRENKRKKELENLQQRFGSCSEGLSLARRLPDVVVQVLGTRLETELSGRYLEMVKEARVGSLTDGIRTQNGFEAVAVCDKRQVRSNAAKIQSMSQELQDESAKMTARKFMRDLKRNASIEYK